MPEAVNLIYVDMAGAAGGGPSAGGGQPGYGARVKTRLFVTPGTEIYVYVGGQGSTSGAGGWNGGGTG